MLFSLAGVEAEHGQNSREGRGAERLMTRKTDKRTKSTGKERITQERQEGIDNCLGAAPCCYTTTLWILVGGWCCGRNAAPSPWCLAPVCSCVCSLACAEGFCLLFWAEINRVKILYHNTYVGLRGGVPTWPCAARKKSRTILVAPCRHVGWSVFSTISG